MKAFGEFQTDPHWRDLILFHEYFHGDSGRGLGAAFDPNAGCPNWRKIAISPTTLL